MKYIIVPCVVIILMFSSLIMGIAFLYSTKITETKKSVQDISIGSKVSIHIPINSWKVSSDDKNRIETTVYIGDCFLPISGLIAVKDKKIKPIRVTLEYEQ